MTTQQRRDAILAAIKDSGQPISAKQLAQTYHVS
ncbi:small molecules-binding protein, partial [Latilactobacillus sakei]